MIIVYLWLWLSGLPLMSALVLQGGCSTAGAGVSHRHQCVRPDCYVPWCQARPSQAVGSIQAARGERNNKRETTRAGLQLYRDVRMLHGCEVLWQLGALLLHMSMPGMQLACHPIWQAASPASDPVVCVAVVVAMLVVAPQADAAAAEDTPVFLYHKAYLRPGAAPPPQEPLPMLEVTGVLHSQTTKQQPGGPCVCLPALQLPHLCRVDCRGGSISKSNEGGAQSASQEERV